MRIHLLFCLTSYLLISNSNALLGQFIDYKTYEIKSIENSVYIYKDNYNSITIDSILTNKNSYSFTKQQNPNLGLSESSFWIKFTLKNNSITNDLVLKINQPLLDNIDFYKVVNGSVVLTKTYKEEDPFYTKKYQTTSCIFDLALPKNKVATYYLRIKSKEPIYLNIEVCPKYSALQVESKKELFLGLYVGIIMVMILYNLFIFITTLDASYLYYVIYIAFVGLTQISLQGFGFKYLWPNAPSLNDYTNIFFSSIGAIAAIRFVKVFLQTKKNEPKLHRFFYIFEFTFIASILFLLLGCSLHSFLIIQLATLLLSLYILHVAYKVVMQGYRPALFFLFAWFILLISAFIFIMKDFWLIPYNTLTSYAMQIGSSIELILLSFALADRITILKKEKEQSQTQALLALEENQKIIQEQNQFLEDKVKERTFELEKSNTELNSTLTTLKDTQSQLVNSEKMASLGILTAGIAHEINNPINFVTSNIKPLKRDIDDIHTLIDKYSSIDYLNPIHTKEAIDASNSFKNEIGYEYLKQEINDLIKGIEEGAVRTANIVKGLRIFSRLDESNLKKANLVEGLESTLALLNPELNQGEILVTKHYSPIPLVDCFPGKLNQVFMNILTNAIYAIKANTTRKERGNLSIETSSDGQYVSIKIKDNGTGMSEDVKRKIFEPFYTTKEVGKGTGLGLSIVFSIISDHKGKIEVISELPKGTEFAITLKINQQ